MKNPRRRPFTAPLATASTEAGTTSYVYNNSGNLMVRRDPGKVTLFLDDQQLVLDTATHAVTGTRYYAIDGTTIAERSSAGPIQYLIPDHQGTAHLAIDSATFTVTRRQYLPFGQARGTASSTWPGDLGYIGGTPEPDTNLENLGAREYDPSTGRFLSPDPVFQANDPSQLGGYAYAANNPTTRSDPTSEDPPGPCSKYDTRACTPQTADYLNTNYDTVDGCERDRSTAHCVDNGGTAGGVTGGGSSKNYSTLHNKVAEDAAATIWFHATELGMNPIKIDLHFNIEHASKSCKEEDIELCNTGYADIVLQVLETNGNISDYLWEVKKWTIGPEKAQKEAQAYVDQYNANQKTSSTEHAYLDGTSKGPTLVPIPDRIPDIGVH